MRTDTNSNASTARTAATHDVNDALNALGKSKDDITRDLRELVDQGQALLSGSGALSSARLEEVMAKLRMRLADAQAKAFELADGAKDRGREYARTADDYVHNNPWPVIAGAGLAGVLIGLLCSSRR